MREETVGQTQHHETRAECPDHGLLRQETIDTVLKGEALEYVGDTPDE
jgi:hypothetical protein